MDKPETINDLKEYESEKKSLSPQQHLAMKNFDRYRYLILTNVKGEKEFQMEFHRLQSLANLTSYEEFLKEEYL